MWWIVGTAYATWTVAAVDPDTGEVGVAGATCGPMVWMVAEVAPGEGAVAAQYDTSLSGKRAIAEALSEGATPERALERATDPAEDGRLALRQYGVVGFAGPSAGFTGGEVEGVAGWKGDDTISVQGNTLRGALVLQDAFDAASGEGTLTDRLLAGLEAGRDAGGDARCDRDQPEKSAFLFVADPGDDPGRPKVEIRASGAFRSLDPVARVRAELEGAAGCDTSGSPAGALVALLAAVAARRSRSG